MDVFCDPVLIRELAEPGSDVRHGVNFVARPPREIISEITRIQAMLRRVEPGQYYYPSPDLHLTVFEISQSLKPEEAAFVAESAGLRSDLLLKNLPSFVLHSPTMIFDERGTALRFEPDERFMSLRSLIDRRLSALGVSVMARDGFVSPHVTFMRYLQPQANADVWLNLLRDIRPEPSLTWPVTELWLTWGATWFGMRSRIKEQGPYPLS